MNRTTDRRGKANNRFMGEELGNFAARILVEAGLTQTEAAVVSESLIEAERRGLGSHGMTRLRTYAKRVRAGVVKANVEPKIVNDSPTALAVDGGNGMGISVGLKVMQLCVERAHKYGCCFAAVNHGNHFGIGAFFTMYAAREGMIGLAMSNAPASMVPTGGKHPMLGTNPLSIAIPAGEYPPLVLDMATSTVAQGKVILAAKEGKDSIPNSWAVDENGVPTTDPQAALRGAMLPFGGAKGYAIALIIDILCSALSGALNSTHIRSYWDNFEQPQELGYFMGVWNVESFLPLGRFRQRVDALFKEIKACPCAPGYDQVLIPGEIEYQLWQKSRSEGIELGPAVVDEMKKLGLQYNVRFPHSPQPGS